MTCEYCGTYNSEPDHRCVQCRRRLPSRGPVSAPETYPVDGVHVLKPVRMPDPVASASVEAVARGSYQKQLFPTREPGQVVSIQGNSAPRGPRGRRADSSPRVVSQQEAEPAAFQQTLFAADVGTAWSRRSTVSDRTSRDPVALPIHRGMAGAIDLSFVVIALSLPMGLCYWLAGDALVNQLTLPWFGLFGILIGIGYKLLWALAGTDSPGLQWLRLRLTTFDDGPPSRRERVLRLFSGILSLMSGGLGFLWALVDEEKLSWHDHMSKTFLTSAEARDGWRL